MYPEINASAFLSFCLITSAETFGTCEVVPEYKYGARVGKASRLEVDWKFRILLCCLKNLLADRAGSELLAVSHSESGTQMLRDVFLLHVLVSDYGSANFSVLYLDNGFPSTVEH